MIAYKHTNTTPADQNQRERSCEQELHLQAFGEAAVNGETERWGEGEEERDPEGLTAVAAPLRACQG